jgi:uncharacterized Tic20 family protein
MNPFKILQIRKNIKEARSNPGQFAGEQAGELLWGILVIPIIIVALVLGLFFIVGYTDVFGFQLGFFKFLFWVALIVSFSVFSILRRIIKVASKITTKQTRRVVDAVVVEDDKG